MAKIPTPRSLNRIVGDMIDVFLSKYGLKQLKIASPVLSILEAAGMSDLRSSQDTFDLLASKDLNRAKGVALDRIGADEDLPRRTESTASGAVTVRDSRIQKISTRIYQGKSSPVANSAQINVVDAGNGWPASGSIYLGRGTPNLEGPLAYTSKTNNGSYWTLNLAPGNFTKKFHNTGETVILAQNGNRQIGAGTTPQTPQGNTSDAVQYSILYPVVIPDGEVQIEGVLVVAKKPGVIGNVPAGAINGFQSLPFPGATVTNPLPFSNAQATEDDDTYRDRIKDVRQSRTKGTKLAIKTSVINITSSDENKRVTSASMVSRQGLPSTLYIDDGTGYEERSEGIAIESLNDSSLGGEEYFQLSERPVTKAYLTTTVTAPFALVDGQKLAVLVGGVRYEHTFSAASFRSIANASGYEIASSINGDQNLLFSARTLDGGTRVVIFAKTEQNEDVEVVAPVSGSNSNDVLLFPSGRAYTLRLYKNDVLLSKDGEVATVRGGVSSTWGVLSGSETLTIAVDHTPAQPYTFSSQDFVDAGTDFSTLANHTVAAWVKVLNYRIPGITATESGGAITLTSNLGRTARAGVRITGGSLVTSLMFQDADVSGANNDYTLNRNTGQIHLEKSLLAGDRLAAGTVNARAFIESAQISPITLATDGHLYVAVDGDAEIINTGITSASNFSITATASANFTRVRFTATDVGSTPFVNAALGDWFVIWDSAIQAALRGLWRVVRVDGTGTWLEFETDAAFTPSPATGQFTNLGVVLVRYAGQLQRVTIPAGPNYTASTFVESLNEQLRGSTAVTYRTTRIRVRTNSFDDQGDIAVVGADSEGKKLLLAASSAVDNRDSHLGSVESGNSEAGTPDFVTRSATAATANDSFDVTTPPSAILPNQFVVGLKNLPESGIERYNNNRDERAFINVVTGSGLTLRENAPQGWLTTDRFYLGSSYALTPGDDMTLVADEDTITKRFTVPFWRALKTVGTTYAATNTFLDQGDGTLTPVTLASAFGLEYDFNDHAIFMRARIKTHDADSTKRILWRYKRFGPEGNKARIRYVYPATPASNVRVIVDEMPTTAPGETQISIALPSDVRKTIPQLRNSTSVGYGYYQGASPLAMVTVAVGFPIATAVRVTNVVTLDLTLPNGLYAITSHGIPNGSNIWVQSTDPNFPSGVKTVTSTPTATTITYAETAADAVGSNIGTLSLDPTGPASFANATPTILAIGDLVRLEDYTTIPAQLRGSTIRVSSLGPQFIQGFAEREQGSENQTLAWTALNDASKIVAYPLKASGATATAIAAAVNVFDAKCPVTATVIGAGSGQVLLSSREEAMANTWFNLVDGVNWVKTTTLPPTSTDDYDLEFKQGIESSLASDSDWANEQVRIVPLTAKALVAWMLVPSVAGVFTSASVAATAQAAKVQLASLAPGSAGSIQVQGGTGNSSVAGVLGTSSSAGAFTLASFRAADLAGFGAGQWVSLDNTGALPRAGIFTASSNLQTITAAGEFVLTPGSPPLYTRIGSTLANALVQVEKQGDFVHFAVDLSGLGGSPVEGDFVQVQQGTSTPVASSNCVLTRVVRADVNGFWIENPNVVEESLVNARLDFYTSTSLMPGDVLSISTDLWGVGNRGFWTVQFIGDRLQPDPKPTFNDDKQFRAVRQDGAAPAAFGDPSPTPVGPLGTTEVKKVVVIEGQPSRMIKRIHALIPNQFDATVLDAKFDSSQRSTFITAAAGTVMTALDKLDFPLILSRGIDGYDHSVGLIGEASRVVYGDERDTTTYPAVIAEGATVNISGPLVKRVSIGIGIRARLGVSTSDIADKVRSAVASVVNKTGVGQSIAISDIVSAAMRVNGVQAVTIIFPTYGVGNDLISVQPFEKPLILNVDQDITVSFIGD